METSFLVTWRPGPHLRSLIAAMMFFAPIAIARAQQPTAVSKAFLTQESVVAVTLKPKQILTNPTNALLPTEITKAVGEKYLGMDLAHVVRGVAVVEPPLGTQVNYAIFLQSDQAWNLTALAQDLTAHTQPGKIKGRDCLLSAHPAMPCYLVLNEKMLVAGSQGMLEKLMGEERGKADSVLSRLTTQQPGDDDLYVAVDMEGLRPLISLGLMQAAAQAPPAMQRFFEIPTLLQSAELSVTLDGSKPSRLAMHAASESEAAQIEGMLGDAVQMAKTQMRSEMDDQMAAMRSSDDPVEQSVAAYMDRLMNGYTDMFVPKREGNSFVLFDTADAGGKQFGAVAVIGVLVALLLPAVQAAREAARRNMSMNNCKQLLLCMHNYHDANKSFPAHAIYSEDGKPLLSWRVAMLPYVEQAALYEQFHLDEPWDSEHNKKLIPLMPDVFLSPNSANDLSAGKSNYVAPVGKGLLFDGNQAGSTMHEVTDGLSNTLCLLEVSDKQAVQWTKPADWKYDRKSPLKGLGGVRPGVFLAGFADGHVSAIDERIDPQVFSAILTKAGGEASSVD